VITRISPDSPASNAGLQVGDIIRAMNGFVIRTKREFNAQMDGIIAGDHVFIKADRDGRVWTASMLASVDDSASTSDEDIKILRVTSGLTTTNLSLGRSMSVEPFDGMLENLEDESEPNWAILDQ